MQHAYLADAIVTLESSATEAVDTLVKAMRAEGVDDIISLGVGEPCFDTPQNIKKAAVQALMAGETKYQPMAGVLRLREAIRQKLKTENRIDTPVDNIVVTAGGKFAIYLVFSAMLQKGDTVVLLDPAWVSYEAAARMNGARVVRVPSIADDGFLPNPQLLADVMNDAVKIVVVNSPCNPSGAVCSPDRLHRIAALAERHGAMLLSDEVYEYQIYGRRHYSPAADFENVITVNSFSKSHAMTGWRLGYAAAPAEIVDGMKKIYSHSTSCVTSFAQWGAIEALESALSKNEVQKMRNTYAQNRQTMIQRIQDSAYLDLAREPEGAFYCFPSYRFKMGSVDLAAKIMQRCHVATVPGVAFGKCGEGCLRLSYAAGPTEIEDAMDRMEIFFKTLEKQNR